ncbi:MAG TPA: hypothetical protein VKE24_04485 [Candidatus Acidoferrales bacterium]|nr:hypothetical protein [Candidatus Acidoferrales bacterium]
MRLKNYGAVLCLLCAVVAHAQVKASGIIKCSKPDVQHKIDVGPSHAFVLEQAKCSADKDKPYEINGVKSGSGVSTNSTEAQGNKSRFQGYYVDTMENGDKGEYSFHGTATMKDAALQTAEDSWTLVHGTGKLKGAKGKGTCKGTGAADGSITWECQGEYTFATK